MIFLQLRRHTDKYEVVRFGAVVNLSTRQKLMKNGGTVVCCYLTSAKVVGEKKEAEEKIEDSSGSKLPFTLVKRKKKRIAPVISTSSVDRLAFSGELKENKKKPSVHRPGSLSTAISPTTSLSPLSSPSPPPEGIGPPENLPKVAPGGNSNKEDPSLALLFQYISPKVPIPASTEERINVLRSKAIPSVGIILYTIATGTGEIQYLLGQRRDTISYGEFLRNKAVSKSDITKHIALMSDSEKMRILEYRHRFATLWSDFWVNHRNQYYESEFKECYSAFRNKVNDYYTELTVKSNRKDTPWEFPKGRHYKGEEGIHCAFRETHEETSIPRRKIKIIEGEKVIRGEIYKGTDDRLYGSYYYMGYVQPNTHIFKQRTTSSRIRRTSISSEFQDVKWLSYTEAVGVLNKPRRALLGEVNEFLLTHLKENPEFYSTSPEPPSPPPGTTENKPEEKNITI